VGWREAVGVRRGAADGGRVRGYTRAVREPLAYFLTWRTYGTWLHGDDRGSVDREHNTYGAALLRPEPACVERNCGRMRDRPVVLDQEQRRHVDLAIRSRCLAAGWELLALNVRTNHVHVVLGASEPPDQVMVSLKAWATRRLRECGLAPSGRTWARHGSTRYIWDATGLAHVCLYVTDLQDSPHS